MKGYNPATDSTLPTSGKKRKREETVDTEETNGEVESMAKKLSLSFFKVFMK